MADDRIKHLMNDNPKLKELDAILNERGQANITLMIIRFMLDIETTVNIPKIGLPDHIEINLLENLVNTLKYSLDYMELEYEYNPDNYTFINKQGTKIIFKSKEKNENG